MLHEIETFQSSEVRSLIDQIRREESRFDFNMRSSTREKIFLPVDIRALDSREEVRAFSRNLSVTGVCLISEAPIPIAEQRLLRFLRQDAMTCEIIAECRWAKSYGHGYTLSGWQFTEAVFG